MTTQIFLRNTGEKTCNNPKGLSDYWQVIPDFLTVLIVPIVLNFKIHFYKWADGWTVFVSYAPRKPGYLFAIFALVESSFFVCKTTTSLIYDCKLKTFRSLCSHAVLILGESSNSRKWSGEWTKVCLEIS